MVKGKYTVEVDISKATEALKEVRAQLDEILDGIDEATEKAVKLRDALRDCIQRVDE